MEKLNRKLCCPGAMTQRWASQTCHTLQRITASLMKGLIWNSLVLSLKNRENLRYTNGDQTCHSRWILKFFGVGARLRKYYRRIDFVGVFANVILKKISKLLATRFRFIKFMSTTISGQWLFKTFIFYVRIIARNETLHFCYYHSLADRK